MPLMKTTPFGPIDVVDAHAHLFSYRFFDILASQHVGLCDETNRVSKVCQAAGVAEPPQDPKELARMWVDELDRNGVSAALMMASLPGDEESVGAAVAAFPKRIAGSFMIDPTRDDVVDRAVTAFDHLHLKVACLFPAMHRFSLPDCEGARAIAALVDDRPGTAVFVHFGALSVGIRKKLGLPSRFDMRYSNPIDLHPVASEFRRTNFIVPHFGAGMLRETLMVADLCENVYVDTSSSNKWIAYQPSPIDLATVFRRALGVVGPGRLLFGSDSSFFPRGWNAQVFDAQVAALEAAGATQDHARAIFGGNLRRLLELEGSV